MIERRPLGQTGLLLSAVGVGTTRFPHSELQDSAGLDRCAALLAEAVRSGVNVVDQAFSYAEGHSGEICARLLRLVPREDVCLAVKCNPDSDPTAADALRRVESALAETGARYFDLLYLWSVKSLAQFERAVRPGGTFEGMREAKRRGLARCLLVSLHAPPQDARVILESGLFEGALLSCNLLSRRESAPLIELAASRGMGVLIMNPLAGGLIPQNEALFASARLPGDESTAEAALRFASSRPGVTCVLAGIACRRDWEQAEHAFSGWVPAPGEAERRLRAAQGAFAASGLCTGCGYCRDACPLGLPVPEWMQSYNQKLLAQPPELYGVTDPAQIARLSVLGRLVHGFSLLPESGTSPCLRCGKCAAACTQHLPVPQRIAELFRMAEDAGATSQAHRERLDALLNGRGYTRVGFWPASAATSFVLSEYRRFFGEPPFEPIFFDSAPGPSLEGRPVYGKEDLTRGKPAWRCGPRVRFGGAICREAGPLCDSLHIPLVKLFRPGDAPWVF